MYNPRTAAALNFSLIKLYSILLSYSVTSPQLFAGILLHEDYSENTF